MGLGILKYTWQVAYTTWPSSFLFNVFSHNKLKELPLELWGLTNLRSLHLQQNQLEGLPQEIAQLINLDEIVGVVLTCDCVIVENGSLDKYLLE